MLRCIVPRVATTALNDSADVGTWRVHGGADHVDRASFEHGGNASFIVSDGADLDIAVDIVRLGGAGPPPALDPR